MMSLPTPVDLSTVLRSDILDDGEKPQVAEKQTLNIGFVTHAFIVFHFRAFDELGLADKEKYFDLLLRLFVCLQTIHSKQSRLLLDMVLPGNCGLQAIPPHDPRSQFNPRLLPTRSSQPNATGVQPVYGCS